MLKQHDCKPPKVGINPNESRTWTCECGATWTFTETYVGGGFYEWVRDAPSDE